MLVRTLSVRGRVFWCMCHVGVGFGGLALWRTAVGTRVGHVAFAHSNNDVARFGHSLSSGFPLDLNHGDL